MIYILLTSGCVEDTKTVEVRNSVPTISIESHVDGDTVFVGDAIEFRALVTDNNNGPSELEVQWEAGDRVACPYTPPDGGGLSTCVTTLELGEEEVKATVRDPKNASATDGVQLVLYYSEPPTAQILAPLSDGIYYADELILFEGTAEDDEDDPTQLDIRWNSSISGNLDLDTTPDSDGSFSDYAYLEPGDHALTLEVEDTSGKVSSQDVVITVKETNTAPTCEITAPDDGSAGTEGVLVVFEATTSDADIPASDLEVSFSSNIDGLIGEVTPSSTGNIEFPYSDLTLGNHLITMTVTDEIGGTCVDTVIYTVGSPPTLTMTQPNPGETYAQGMPITFSAEVVDNEDAPADISVTWVSDIDGEFSTKGPNSSDLAQFTYSDLSPGNHTVTVTATDSTGLFDDAIISFIVNGVPNQPTSLTISPDPATTSQSLTALASGSVDPDGSSVSYNYEWLLSGSTMSVGPTLDSSMTTKGDFWTVRATPFDGVSSGQYAETSITIANSEPVVSTVTLSPTAPTTQDDITCTYVATDPDVNDNLTATFSWSINGGTTSETSSQLSGPFQFESEITCTVTVSDGIASTSSSSTLTIGNTPPEIASVTFSSTEVYTEDFLNVVVSASDAESDPISYTYEWYVNGSAAFSETKSTNNASLDGIDHFDRDDSVYVVVTADDGAGNSSLTSETVIVLNTPPSVFNTQISPLEPVSGQDDLVCTTQYSNPDIDGDTVSLTYEWLVDDGSGSQTTTFTSDTVDGAETNTGEFWTCIVTPNDGTDDGEPSSAVVEIDGNAEGTQGYSFCAAGGSVSNSNYQMTFCLGPESLVVGEVSNGNYTMQMGPIYRYVPN